MKTSNSLFKNVSDTDVLKMLDICPSILSRLSKRKSAIDSYDSLAFRNGIKFGTMPVYINDTEKIHHFEYWTRIDGERRQPNEEYATKAEAQLRAVHETMYRLEQKLNTNNRNIL